MPGLGAAAAEAGQQQGAGRGEAAAAAAEPPAAAAPAGADRGGEGPPVAIVFPGDMTSECVFARVYASWRPPAHALFGITTSRLCL